HNNEGDGATCKHKHFYQRIKVSRVGTFGARYRQNHLQLFVSKEGRTEQRFLRLHLVDVSSDRIDFPIVGDKTERLRQLPVRKGVCREARVNQRYRCTQSIILKILEVTAKLFSTQLPFVDKGARRKTCYVKLRIVAIHLARNTV